MAAIDFPTSPTEGDTFQANGFTWEWDGVAWVSAHIDLRTLVYGKINDYLTANPPDDFDSATLLVAAQTNAPTGWTKNTSHNDKALRLVSGTASSGGSNPFSSTFASRTPTGTLSSDSLSTAQLSSHLHTLPRNSGPTVSSAPGPVGGGNTGAPAASSGPAGSGSTHSHTFTGGAMDFATTYVDVILIARD